jgi:hypothetical protein
VSEFLMVRHTVSYLPHWKEIFDKKQKYANDFGLKALYVMRDLEQSNITTILMLVENIELAKKFMASSYLKDAMKQAGVITEPEITYLSDAIEK